MAKKLLAMVAIAVLALVGGGYVLRNMLVAGAIEAGGNAALRVDTEVRSASLELGAGSLELRNYRIHNPDGFSGTSFLTIARGKVAVNTGSLLDDEVVIDSVILEGLELNLEQIDSRGNFSELLKNISELDSGPESESEKRVRISSVYVKDLSVNASLVALGKNRASSSEHIEELVFNDIGGKSGGTVAQVVGEVVSRLLKKTLTESRGSLPGGFDADLEGVKKNIIKQAGESVKKLGESFLNK